MKMKKIILAVLVAISMLLIPVTTNAVTVDIENNPIINADEEEPEIFILPEEKFTLDAFIEKNFDEEEKLEAYAIMNDILSFDAENVVYIVNVDPLLQAIDDYSYFHIIDEERIENVEDHDELYNLIDTYWSYSDFPYAGLINAIVEIIKGRLGWLYELFYEGKELFIAGVDLAKQFIKNIQNLDLAIGFTLVINLLVSIPVLYFSNLIKTLFHLNAQGFIENVTMFTNAFTTELDNLISWAEALLELLGEIFEPLLLYVQDIGEFVDWVRASPWENDIVVKGTATAVNLFGEIEPISSAQITCRGVTTTTDSEGNFELIVSPDDTSDSIPPGSFYGLHNCQITIQDGEKTKQTPKLLSYVASNGSIQWPFIVIRSRSVANNFITVILEKFEIFLQRINLFFPNFYKIINTFLIL